MRFCRRALPAFLLLVVASCAHEGRQDAAPKAPTPRASGVPAPPPQYLVADPSVKGGVAGLSLGVAGVYGLVVDKSRVVVGRGEPRVAPDVTDRPISGALPLPKRLGGGFLFWTDHELYRASAFDAALSPIAKVPDPIQSLALAPKYVLVKTQNGERWSVGLPSGAREPLLPLGVADIEALDDGRVIAFNDLGAAFTSLDGGEHWNDVTAQIRSSLVRAADIEGELWLIESSGGAHRLETDGRLSWFDAPPPEKPLEVRARDPRWRGAEAPLRAVFHSGAAIDDATGIVLEDGDLVRVDLRTGELAGVRAGKLPPGAQCEAVSASGDVLFACTQRGGSATISFVVSHTLFADDPVVEQSLPGALGFYVSDDGGIAYAGPCDANTAMSSSADGAACVRQPDGSWEEQGLSAFSGDAGVTSAQVLRWIPRADGRAVALVQEPELALYEPRTGLRRELVGDARDVTDAAANYYAARHARHAGPRDGFVDGSWSFTGSTLRGWRVRGGNVEITDDGRVRPSPYALDEVAFTGPLGLGRTADGRLYQSTDRGASWVEVAGPPSGHALELRACSSAGCDLGAFYRVGWSVRSPRVQAQSTPAPRAAEVQRSRALELSCRPNGPVSSKVLPRTSSSPEDLGLGLARLPTNEGEWQYVRNSVPIGIQSPVHEGSSVDGESSALRGLFSGFQTSRDGDVLTVLGPNKSAAGLRRSLSFVPPFDPAARIVRTGIAMRDVLNAGRVAGMASDEILSDDMTESGAILALTPIDPGAVSDVAVNHPRGMIVVFRGERTRVAMRPSQGDNVVISGASLVGDETAFLEIDSGTGVGHVFKVGSSGVTDLFDVNPTMTDATFYPANPDAVAVGPKGELAILRTPSGSDPSSSYDPAYLIVSATPPRPLAPWSQLRFADDPACKSEQGGYRATLQLIAPWVRIATPDLRVAQAPMLARVRWTEKLVCLEGVEAKMAEVTIRSAATSSSESIVVGTSLVGRGSSFARVGIGEGVEWRQPLECSIVPTR